MNRVYGDPVGVRAREDGRPTRFVWRGRLYTVRAILEHWVVNREWWRAPGSAGEQSEEATRGEWVRPELEFWRVEASSGPGMTAGIYELRREAATGAWTLRQGLA
jgi:hypothetical protein